MSLTYMLLLLCPLIYTRPRSEIAGLRLSYESRDRRIDGEMIY